MAPAEQPGDAATREEHLKDMGVDLPDVTVEVAKLPAATAGHCRRPVGLLGRQDPAPGRTAGGDGRQGGCLILDLIRDLKERGNVSIIIIAHNYAQVLDVCDRVNLLQHGEITFDKRAVDTSLEELTELVVRGVPGRPRAAGADTSS
jgi:hypothetical protein